MQELVGRLTALDPEASESLKVIAYFDALVNGHANTEVLLRGAAVLSGCPAGYSIAGSTLRVTGAGTREHGDAAGWPTHEFADGGIAWIERTGDPHANDEMILERLAIGLGISFDRTSPDAGSRRAIETIIDSGVSVTTRLEAATRLRLDPRGLYRVVAVPSSVQLSGGTAVITTRFGSARVAIREAAAPFAGTAVGVGVAAAPDGLDGSWESALVALRLAVDSPILADDLGAILTLASAVDSGTGDHPEAERIVQLLHAHPKALPLLDAVAVTDSLRAVATSIGLHHSTVQARVAEFSDELDYDLRAPGGRVRLSLALALYRLATVRL